MLALLQAKELYLLVFRARYWMPCVDFPQVRQRLEFLLTSDASHTMVANGVLQSEVTKDGRKTSHWKLDFPCPSYLACIAVGEVGSFFSPCMVADVNETDRPPVPVVERRGSKRRTNCLPWLQRGAGRKCMSFITTNCSRLFLTASLCVSKLRLIFDKTPSMMKWLTKKLERPFPFPKYYQIIVPKICARSNFMF